MTGLNQDQITQVRLDSVSNPLIPMEQDSTEERSLLEVLHDDNESNALDVLLDVRLRMQIEIALKILQIERRQCILLYYGRNMNLQEISEVFELTTARISQLLSVARKELKSKSCNIRKAYNRNNEYKMNIK